MGMGPGAFGGKRVPTQAPHGWVFASPNGAEGPKLKAAIGGFWPQPSDGSPEASNRTAQWYRGMSTNKLDIFALVSGRSQFGARHRL